MFLLFYFCFYRLALCSEVDLFYFCFYRLALCSEVDLFYICFYRLALCSEVDTTEFFISAETTLFEFRFLCMNEEELRELFRNTEKSFEKGSRQNSSKCSALLNIFEILKERTKSWEKVVKLYLKGDNSHYFHVPFYHVPNFVAKRQVVLSNGIAAVPFPKMREIITNSFKEVLEEGMKIAREKRCIAEMDLRMKKLLRKLVVGFVLKSLIATVTQ